MIYWLFPKWVKRRKKQERKIDSIKSINKFSKRWYKKIGIWVVSFLLILAFTGMFLRPPLLIPIANASVRKIPYTLLDSPNPWFDKLRRILYDEHNGRFLIGTNQGIFYSDNQFVSNLKTFANEPPVSVMGINVFEKVNEGTYLVGSFNGLFLWNPGQNFILDYLNPDKEVELKTKGSPLGENMTAGYIKLGDDEIIFDYNRGAEIRKGDHSFPVMPIEIIKTSPMSLWNLALEFHTTRYYKFIVGDFYILLIPLFALTMLLVLVTGIFLWLKIPKKQSKLK